MRPALTLLLVLFAAAPARAGIWTPVTSPTTADITAVDYRPDALRIASANGRIYRREADGSFIQEANLPGRRILALRMSPSGTTGLAAADTGRLYRYSNGAWSAVNLVGTTYPFATCAATPQSAVPRLAAPTTDLVSVAWSSEKTAWVASSAPGQILESTDGGQTFKDVSRQGDQTCRLPARITDIEPVAGSDFDVFFVDADGAGLWRTRDGLASAPTRRVALVGCSATSYRAAMDPANPRRISAVGPCDGPEHQGFTDDAGATRDFTASGPARPRDIAATSGVFLAVGDAGKIEQTRDGRTTVAQPADGALATAAWRAVDFADATHALIGGTGGVLAISDKAGAVPDELSPTVTIAGKLRVAFGLPHTYTAIAQDVGGAGIDPHGFSWASPGLPTPATGNAQTFTFPAPGVYGITVTARDRDGNTGATSFTVTAGRRFFSRPTARMRARARGRGRHRVVAFSLRGSYRPPPGLAQAQSCSGPVVVRIRRGRALLAQRRLKLSTRCTYATSARFGPRRIGRATSLSATVSFGGNPIVNPNRRRYLARIR